MSKGPTGPTALAGTALAGTAVSAIAATTPITVISMRRRMRFIAPFPETLISQLMTFGDGAAISLLPHCSYDVQSVDYKFASSAPRHIRTDALFAVGARQARSPFRAPRHRRRHGPRMGGADLPGIDGFEACRQCAHFRDPYPEFRRSWAHDCDRLRVGVGQQVAGCSGTAPRGRGRPARLGAGFAGRAPGVPARRRAPP